jgi:threonine/homoserine/homoserine lactone efflux protein
MAAFIYYLKYLAYFYFMIEAILKGLAISLLLVFSVGPVIFTIIKQSINHGRSGGFSFVAGVWLSDIIWVVLSNGFSEVIKSIESFMIPIGIGGGIFLLGMGIYFAFIKKMQPRQTNIDVEIAGDVITAAGKKKVNYISIFSSGFLINTLNPSVIAFWVATSIALAKDYSFNQRIIILTTCLAINMLADVAKVLGAGKLGKKLSDKNIFLINRLSGYLYLLFGTVVLGSIIYSIVSN